jgi:hypothetical protein
MMVPQSGRLWLGATAVLLQHAASASRRRRVSARRRSRIWAHRRGSKAVAGARVEARTAQAFADDPRLFPAHRFHHSSARYEVIVDVLMPQVLPAACAAAGRPAYAVPQAGLRGQEAPRVLDR